MPPGQDTERGEHGQGIHLPDGNQLWDGEKPDLGITCVVNARHDTVGRAQVDPDRETGLV
jgi:hypothetical protein